MLSHVAIASLLTVVSAHQNFHQFWVNDVTPGYQVAIRMPPSNSPVTDVTSDDITCNVNGNNVPSGVATATANEGDSIKVQWDSSSHPGPITHFLFGPVTNASMATGVGSWVKIDEFDSENGTWANAIMEAQNMTYTFNLPTGLASGDYLLRSEMLALHGSQTLGGAQFYIGCAQLTITGTAGDSCSPSIQLPGAYNETADDIYIPNFYNGFDISTYTAPGGAVATCGAGSGGASVVASSSAVPTSAPVNSVSSEAAASASAIASSSEIAVSSAVPSTSKAVASSSILPTSTANLAAVTSAPSTNGSASRTKSACKAKTSSLSALNGTASAAPTKSKCACKNKSKTASATKPILSSGATQVQIQTSTSAVPTTLQTIAASTSSAPMSTSTASAESVPSGTTLDNLLSWISSFYSANKGTSYTGSTSA